MDRRTKRRWLCWGTAIAIFASYILALVSHWSGGLDTLPPGTHTIVTVAVFTLILAGRDLGAAKPVMVQVHADEPEVRRQRRRTLQPANTDTPFADRIALMLEEEDGKSG
jgi:hypothetical protein